MTTKQISTLPTGALVRFISTDDPWSSLVPGELGVVVSQEAGDVTMVRFQHSGTVPICPQWDRVEAIQKGAACKPSTQRISPEPAASAGA